MNPGIYDMPAEDYFASPGISASGLKRMLPPYTPAHYRYGEFESSDALDFGKVAHRLVLGAGEEFEVGNFKDWRAKGAAAWKAEVEAAGKVAILLKDFAKAEAMVEQVRRHKLASALFTDGKAEQSLFWNDPETGVLCRARFDWLRNVVEGRRLLIPDYKTARNASREVFSKSAADFGYHVSGVFYAWGAEVLGLDPDALPLFVAQEKTKPYLVNVVALDQEDIDHAKALIRMGLRLYADCLERDEWPGYPDTVSTLELPVYHRIKTEEYLAS